jgi:predicted ATP-dependent endonuclease of OLD family
MILKKLVVKNYGPFHFPAEITIDDKVTVFTGQNDVGKTTLLRLIHKLCQDQIASQNDVNIDRTYFSGSSWDQDGEVECIATFRLEENMRNYQNNDFNAGTEIDIEFKIVTQRRQLVAARKGGNVPFGNPHITGMPTVLFLPNVGRISPLILEEMDEDSLEVEFLTLAFGSNYVRKLRSFDLSRQATEVDRANKRINTMLKDFLPHSLPLEVVIRIVSNEPLSFSINLRDIYGADTTVDLRGSGVKKILMLFVLLLTNSKKYSSSYMIILIDEPETSLHADSQHMLRRVLESLADNNYIQVIYATHSPSMINTLNPQSIRLLGRTERENIATTSVDNRPINEDFLPVRVSLGITASDSLLYAPITVIVEGITEVLSLPLLMQRLYKEKNEEFQDVNSFLSLSHFLDGQGSSFEYLCRLSKSQGCKPIIFVDGDKLREIKKLKIEEKHPEVPIIVLKDGTEFEDIVPHEIYFEALEESIALSDLYIDYQAWLEEKKLPTQMMFSKRVNNFMVDRFPELTFDKSEIMRRAIAKADLDKIDLEKIRQLIMVSKTLL